LYEAASPVTFDLRSASKDQLEYNVAVEEYRDDHWQEVVASVENPTTTKVIALAALSPDQAKSLSFPIRQNNSLLREFKLRLRVDTFRVGKKVQTIYSATFAAKP
jgi:hypothetical protein